MLLACTLIWPNLSISLCFIDNTIYYLLIFIYLVVRDTMAVELSRGGNE